MNIKDSRQTLKSKSKQGNKSKQLKDNKLMFINLHLSGNIC